MRYCGEAVLVSEIKLFLDSSFFGLILQSRHANWVKYYFNLQLTVHTFQNVQALHILGLKTVIKDGQR